jgi:hypothetical protein
MFDLSDVRNGWKATTVTLLLGAALALPFSAIVTIAASALLDLPAQLVVSASAAFQIVLGLAITGRLGGLSEKESGE